MSLSRRALLSQCGLVIAGGAAATMASATTAAAATADLRDVGATRSVTSFVDSVGVNAHWSYLDTPYGSTYPRVRELLRASGIRHVRSWETERIADLFDQGIRTTTLVDTDPEGRGDPVQIARALKPHAASGALAGLEGPNEIDIAWTEGVRQYRGSGFPTGPVLWQEALYETAKADADLRRVPVIGMSFGETYWGGGHPFAPGSLRATADWGNFHPYPSGNPYAPQFRYGGIEKYYADADFPSAALDRHPLNLDTYRPPFGDLPMAATETGYSTWKWGQSERTHGRYLPRMFAENFRLGIVRTYSYELLDLFPDPTGEHRDWNFGLLRNDLSPKPAYRAVQSMLRALTGGDASAPVTDGGSQGDVGGALKVVAAPGYDPSALHHLALRRADGTVILAIWHEVSSNDQTGLEETPKRPMRELRHPAVVVTLDLERGATAASATFIDDSGALRPKALAKRGNAVTLLVGDRLSFVTIPPA